MTSWGPWLFAVVFWDEIRDPVIKGLSHSFWIPMNQSGFNGMIIRLGGRFKDFFHFHPDPWGRFVSILTCAYFSTRWFNQLEGFC